MRNIKNQQFTNQDMLLSVYEKGSKEIKFSNCSFENASFIGVDLSKTIFENCDFTGAIIRPEASEFSFWENMNPFGSNIKKNGFKIAIKPTRDDMQDYAEQLQDPKGEKQLNRFLRTKYGVAKNKLVIADLADLDFSGQSINDQMGGVDVDIDEVRQYQLDFTGADLSGCYMENANFTAVNMENAILYGTNANGANFGEANMQKMQILKNSADYANFANANLNQAIISENSFKNANFENAKMNEAFIDDNFLQSTWLFDAEIEDANGKDVEKIKEIQEKQSKSFVQKIGEKGNAFANRIFSKIDEKVNSSIYSSAKKLLLFTALAGTAGLALGYFFINPYMNSNYVTTTWSEYAPFVGGIFAAIPSALAAASAFDLMPKSAQSFNQGVQKNGFMGHLKQMIIDPQKPYLKNALIYGFLGAIAGSAICATFGAVSPLLAPIMAYIAGTVSIAGFLAGAYHGYNKEIDLTAANSNLPSVSAPSQQVQVAQAHAKQQKLPEHKIDEFSFVDLVNQNAAKAANKVRVL